VRLMTENTEFFSVFSSAGHRSYRGDLFMKKSGIYCIENISNQKIYIGQSINMYKRLLAHKSALQRNSHGNRHLQNSWNRDGEQEFSFYYLLYCEKRELDYYEKEAIKKLKTLKRRFGYNLSTGGNSDRSASEETKLLMSKIGRGRKQANAKSKYMGVYSSGKYGWTGTVGAGSAKKNLGVYKVEKIAAAVRDVYVQKNDLAYPLNFAPKELLDIQKTSEWIYKSSTYKKRENATSKFMGVNILKRKKGPVYIARSRVKKQSVHIGTFSSEVSAARAYDEFVKCNRLNRPLNFPNEE
jgi:group I intron endonuclease